MLHVPGINGERAEKREQYMGKGDDRTSTNVFITMNVSNEKKAATYHDTKQFESVTYLFEVCVCEVVKHIGLEYRRGRSLVHRSSLVRKQLASVLVLIGSR